MKLKTPFALLCASVAAIAGIGSPSLGAQSEMTGSQVLDRCRKAYEALQSYEGTTNVATLSTMNGAHMSYQTSAYIRFARPGKIRVEGTLMTGGKFAFVSDGHSTWQASDFQGGQWQPAQNTEMAIASYTGVSQGAATTIPAILLHTQWGTPFAPGMKANHRVATEMVGGRPTYKVTLKTPTGDRTLWIDRTNFLLVKSRQIIDTSKMRKIMVKMSKQMAQMPQMPGGVMSQINMDSMETYGKVRLNPELPASLFTQPSGKFP